MNAYLNYTSSKDYFFNSNLFYDNQSKKQLLGKNIPEGTDYHVAFKLPRELARRIYSAIRAHYPLVFKHLAYYETKAGDKIYLGGKFPASYKAKDLIFTLIKQG